jgi:hypothetical protein
MNDMSTAEVSYVRRLTGGMRTLLLVFCFTVSVAGFSLFVLTEHTDQFFAWTINPPLTAAFLGACYWGSFPLVLVSSRQDTWAQARTAVLPVLVFSVLTLVATLMHIDRFHLDSGSGWSWLVVYVVVPPAMVVLLVRQLRVRGADPPRRAPLPAWMRLVIGIQAVIMLVLGVALFLGPQTTAALWPWMLTPLTGRVVGAWLVGLSLIAVYTFLENDFGRSYAALITYAVLDALQLLALARYASTPDWSGVSS